jgi:competence protein ComEC
MAATAAAPAPVSTSAPSQPNRSIGSRYFRQPLLQAALAYAAGVILARHFWRPELWLILSTALVLAGALFFLARARERICMTLVFVGLALVGALNQELQPDPAIAMSNNHDFAALTSGEESEVTAHVVRDGMIEPAGAEMRQSVDLETEHVTLDNKDYAVPFGIRLSIYSTAASEDTGNASYRLATFPQHIFRYGERLRFSIRLKQPRNFGDPGAFDYRGYLAQQNIAALGNASAEAIELLPGFTGSRLGGWRSRARRSLQQKIATMWPARDAALISAMLIGDRTGVDRATVEDYQRTGAYHILVVAGLKVGILAAAVLWSMGRLRAPQWLASTATIAISLAYAEITEANAPVVRATTMLAIYLATRLFYRERNSLNAIGAAALGILLWNAQALFDASFKLTFISIIAIAGIALPLIDMSSAPYRRALGHIDSREYDFAMAPKFAQFRLDLRLVATRLARVLGRTPATWLMAATCRAEIAIFDLLVLSSVLQLALAAPMAFYFHRAIALGLPANTAVVPLHSLLLPAAAAAVLLAYGSARVAHVFASATTVLLHATNRVVEALAKWNPHGLPIGDWRLATPHFAALIFSAVAIAFAVMAMQRSKKLVVAGLVLLLAAATWVCLPPMPSITAGELEMTAIDVGQGDSILVVTPEGQTLLIDAGGELGAPGGARFDMGEDVVSPYLWSRGITRLDAVALTHAHADHIGGMPAVIKNFRPRELWVAELPEINAVTNLLRVASENGVRVMQRKASDNFLFGGAAFRVLAPPANWQVAPEKASNNDSLVMKATYRQQSVLLEGDAERKIEEEMVDEDPSATILKVAHHGSATSTIAPMLAAVHPQFAVISVGFRSPFHHPRPDVLGRLQAAHVRTFRTDTMGATSFYLDGKDVHAATGAEDQK